MRSSLHILQLTLSFIGILKRMSGTRVYFFFFNFCFTAIPLQDFYHIHDASKGRQCSVTQLAIHKISGDLLSHPLEQTVKISTSFLFSSWKYSETEQGTGLSKLTVQPKGAHCSVRREIFPLFYKLKQSL